MRYPEERLCDLTDFDFDLDFDLDFELCLRCLVDRPRAGAVACTRLYCRTFFVYESCFYLFYLDWRCFGLVVAVSIYL